MSVKLKNLNYVVHDFTNQAAFLEAINHHQAVYVGFDPTYHTLHIGHIAQLMTLKKLHQLGLKLIIIIGTFSAMIGDPSGKAHERPVLSETQTKSNAASLITSIKKICHKIDIPVTILQNHTWLQDMTLLDFFQLIGKKVNITTSLNKEFIKHRLVSGISYTEFAYSLMQAYDWWVLNQQYDCFVQLGGSDQWGNITTGIDFIKKHDPTINVCGLTTQLLLINHEKISKTEKNAIFIDDDLKTIYNLYFFLINLPDQDVPMFFNQLTDLGCDQIHALATVMDLQTFKKTFVQSVITTLYSEHIFDEIANINQILFANMIITDDMFAKIVQYTGFYEIDRTIDIIDALIMINFGSSKRAIKELINHGAISVNNLKINIQYKLSDFNNPPHHWLVIKKGIKYFKILKLV